MVSEFGRWRQRKTTENRCIKFKGWEASRSVSLPIATAVFGIGLLSFLLRQVGENAIVLLKIRSN